MRSLAVVCATCHKEFGAHSGTTCPGGTGSFVASLLSGKTKAMIEFKKLEDTKGWLDDAYDGYKYGHDGACPVCHSGWNKGTGPKEDDIFPLDGRSGAPKLFHLKCLEKAKGDYPSTWFVYQHWLVTGEILS